MPMDLGALLDNSSKYNTCKIAQTLLGMMPNDLENYKVKCTPYKVLLVSPRVSNINPFHSTTTRVNVAGKFVCI